MSRNILPVCVVWRNPVTSTPFHLQRHFCVYKIFCSEVCCLMLDESRFQIFSDADVWCWFQRCEGFQVCNLAPLGNLFIDGWMLTPYEVGNLRRDGSIPETDFKTHWRYPGSFLINCVDILSFSLPLYFCIILQPALHLHAEVAVYLLYNRSPEQPDSCSNSGHVTRFLLMWMVLHGYPKDSQIQFIPMSQRITLLTYCSVVPKKKLLL